MEIKDKMSAISDSLKPFTPTGNSLIISITRSQAEPRNQNSETDLFDL